MGRAVVLRHEVASSAFERCLLIVIVGSYLQVPAVGFRAAEGDLGWTEILPLKVKVQLRYADVSSNDSH